MYRSTPLSYYIAAIMSTDLSAQTISCSFEDLLRLESPPNQTCDKYLCAPIRVVLNPDARSARELCIYTTVGALLMFFSIGFAERWCRWAFNIAYYVISIGSTILLYRAVKGPKKIVSNIVKNTNNSIWWIISKYVRHYLSLIHQHKDHRPCS